MGTNSDRSVSRILNTNTKTYFEQCKEELTSFHCTPFPNSSAVPKRSFAVESTSQETHHASFSAP